MKKREIADRLLRLANQYPVLTLTGPRQSGKTTLCKALFPAHGYVNLENPVQRAFAIEDPVAFLDQFGDSGVVLDEIQQVPSLLSMIQVRVDEKKANGRFVLTGSHNLKLMSGVSQSLAGRTALATLLPFTMGEFYGERRGDLYEVMWKGLFPRVLAEKLDPVEALQFYTGTYLERDVRDLVRVRDFARFSNFLRLVAGRTGQLLNASTLAADAGISVKTAFEWLSVLEAGYVIRRLQPWFANISKRLSKTPKVYFLDTGLVCSLLGITSSEQLRTHPLRGAIFETLVVTEYWKRQCNTGRGELFHYRDGKQREIDLVRVCDGRTELVEIKSGQTPVSDWHETMDALAGQFGEGTARKVVYGGNMAQMRSDVEYLPWKSL